jgi:hypothetical protein
MIHLNQMRTPTRAFLPPMLFDGGLSGTSLAESQRVKKNLGWFGLSAGLWDTLIFLGRPAATHQRRHVTKRGCLDTLLKPR